MYNSFQAAIGHQHTYSRMSGRISPWQAIPDTPDLPPAKHSGTAQVNGIDLWYAAFGLSLEESKKKQISPVVFLHGGRISSQWWGLQISYLVEQDAYSIFALDSRAQGRSGDDLSQPLRYETLTDDVIALMDHLQIPKFSVVGWSDGGVIGLDLVKRYPSRIDRVFAFGANYSPKNAVTSGIVSSATFMALPQRLQAEYEALSPEPQQFARTVQRVRDMQAALSWTARDFRQVPSIENDRDAPIVWIVGADYEEAIERETFGDMQRWVR